MRVALVLVIAFALAGCSSGRDGGPTVTALPVPPPVLSEVLKIHTEFGTITAVLYETHAGQPVAPKTIELMRAYAQEGYYEGREFQRVVPGHVIQVTDATADATWDKRTVPLEVHDMFDFSAGALGIARGDDTNSGGPQFFIADFATSHLFKNYTVWGQVIEGLDVVHRIARVDAASVPPPPHPAVPYLADRVALDPVQIDRVEILKQELPGLLAEQLPYQTAKIARVPPFRHSLEWPLYNLTRGGPLNLTWYMRPSDSTVPPTPSAPAPSSVAIVLDGVRHRVTGEATATGVYHWSWDAPTEGTFEPTIEVDGTPVVKLQFCLPGPCTNKYKPR